MAERLTSGVSCRLCGGPLEWRAFQWLNGHQESTCRKNKINTVRRGGSRSTYTLGPHEPALPDLNDSEEVSRWLDA